MEGVNEAARLRVPRISVAEAQEGFERRRVRMLRAAAGGSGVVTMRMGTERVTYDFPRVTVTKVVL